MKTINILKNIPAPVDEEFLETLVEHSNVHIVRIVSYGHIAPKEGWYDQAENEWIVVLEGAAILSFPNGEDMKLSKGDSYYIPAHQQHKVSWTAPGEQTIWLACFF
ncbi:MAG: cupin domain-containing protein [Sulfurimonadaceae bacterium]|jgi:cupin 2 domain-containing protein|nr:cupin domain-containing protein [Sulfurimonadaceae bacterium]